MELDTSGWSGDGDFTRRLIEVLSVLPGVRLLKVEDAPASRADAGFSFISNELFVQFETVRRISRGRFLRIIPWNVLREEKVQSLAGLEEAFTSVPDVGPPDYSDDGMVQYLRAERIIPAYQTKAYKLIELVRLYEAGTIPRRDS
ncbi:MAG: hypothetical protein H0T05_02725 [Acidobacteria bacterium]|nr:hypothetical protein [Acidobacteriota bacterium]MBA3887509.1 hypothetical protein [Acidobacteriota bacterium]